MGSAGVVVLEAMLQGALQVPLADEEHAVGALGSDGAHDPFGVGVHPRALRRTPQKRHEDLRVLARWRSERARMLSCRVSGRVKCRSGCLGYVSGGQAA